MHDGRYMPEINFQAGKISSIKIELDKMFFIIRSQQLNPEEIDGMIEINQEDVYNRTNEAMIEF